MCKSHNLELSLELVNARVCASRAPTSGNVKLPWPKLFQAFSVKFTLIFFHECRSFNHSTSAHAKIMHIDEKL